MLIRKFTNPSLIIFSIIALFSLNTIQAQIGIGTTSPDASAMLEVESTEKGFLPPRMDSDARNNINSPAEGLMIYNTDTNCLQFYDGRFWISACDGMPDVSTVIGANGVEWMDRNLGANQVANASNDAASYGDLYQWGRSADGHEDRNSSTASGPVAAGSEGSNFITELVDWLSTPDDDRWNANETSGGSVVKTVNDPCPAGYRVPTEAELDAERANWSSNNAAGAFASPLKLPMAGSRVRTNGSLSSVGTFGFYWSSTVSGTDVSSLRFNSSGASMLTFSRASGYSVRCLKD